jgi:hypothetical protein
MEVETEEETRCGESKRLRKSKKKTAAFICC